MVNRLAHPARQLSWRRKLIYGLITAALVLLAGEGMLRLAGFDARTRVETMQFTFPIDEYNNSSPEPFLQSDPKLFWKPRPNVMGHNSHGTTGQEFASQKTSGVFRIVCLGDSCTHFGPEPYPEMLQQRLDAEAPGRFEVINGGVIGYTSFQGRTLLTERVLGWSPDLVTVYFGWNDHWLARGYEDKDQREPNAAVQTARGVMDGIRIYQLINLAVVQGHSTTNPKLRVEPDDYAENLLQMQRQCEAAGVRILFMTAPQALDLGIPDSC